MRLISQLTNGTSRVLQKLLKYFNVTLILTFLSSVKWTDLGHVLEATRKN